MCIARSALHTSGADCLLVDGPLNQLSRRLLLILLRMSVYVWMIP